MNIKIKMRHFAQLGLATGGVAIIVGIASTGGIAQTSRSVEVTSGQLQAMCTADGAQQIASSLPANRIVVKAVGNGPFKSATSFVAATDRMPAFCQFTGTFVTNPKTGKTANFLATFPANWNGKYLQSGCGGHCGFFIINNPAAPTISGPAQGEPGDIIQRGYAHFATDEGHEGPEFASWAVRPDGTVDQDSIDDWLFRADRVLVRAGKDLTVAFYAKASGTSRAIARSYFNGCSGGGRDALVAASYFPEEFDGIIAGSAYNPVGLAYQNAGIELAQSRPNASLSPALLSNMDRLVKAQCDGLDGVKDGIIQNPAACHFNPERDLPKCANDKTGGQCFTKAQVETASVMLSAVTDDRGTVIQPGYSVSELSATSPVPGIGAAVQKVFVHRNDPAFSLKSIYQLRAGGPGPITAFRSVVPSTEVQLARAALRTGIGHFPENADRLMRSRTKLLMWHNLSDEALSPYMSVNYYKQLAARNGGYRKLQDKARLFLLPGTTHCSASGIAPNSFDALGALENWVERGTAPDALRTSVKDRQFWPGFAKASALKYPNWTQLLCKFPEMARYNGRGDVKDAANWSCPPSDRRMLKIGETGRRAGIL